MPDSPKGCVYLVPTPIGNMGDITTRAVDTLRSVDLVACEDTRHSGKLLKELGLHKKLMSYHDFNEAARSQHLVNLLQSGKSIAVVTDAGSPGISDPAYRLVRGAIDGGIDVVPLPGPCAIIPALTASGLPTDRFFFEGFLPQKGAARKKRLRQLVDLEHTLVFYESPHRIVKTMSDVAEIFGDRQACIAREISKKFEQFIRGSASDLLERISTRPPKGEIVLIVKGRT